MSRTSRFDPTPAPRAEVRPRTPRPPTASSGIVPAIDRGTKRRPLDPDNVVEDTRELIGALVGGRYLVRSVLGTGGMGVVYLARHEALGRDFALKVLRRDIVVEPESVERFTRETRITASLRHPNLVEVIDVGELTSADVPSLGALRQPYFVMELLQGRTLGEEMLTGPIDPRKVATIGAQVAAGLAVAHDAGVIHRDLKPDNIFLVRTGGAPLVKVLDFGVAKLLHAAKLTRPNTVFGTPYYMSPEQASDQVLDGRVDQYALGVVMFEALTGQVPFEDTTHLGVMRKHVDEPAPDVLARVPEPATAGIIAPIVMRCLAKSPDGRWGSTHDLARSLEHVADETWFAVRSSSLGSMVPATSLGTSGGAGDAVANRPSGRIVTAPPFAPTDGYRALEVEPARYSAPPRTRAPRLRAISLERSLVFALAGLLALSAILAVLLLVRP